MVKRRAGWYFRMRVPADLKPIFNSHVVRSLQAATPAAARLRAIRAAAAAPAIWHEVRTMIADFLGKPLDLLQPGDLVGCDRKTALADIERLSPEARRQLRARLEQILRDQFMAVREMRAELEATTTVIDVMRLVRQEGKIEGMREAIAAGAHPAAPPSPALPQLPAAPDPFAELKAEARLPWTDHLEKFFEEQGLAPKTTTEYRHTYERLKQVIGEKPAGLVSHDDLSNFMDVLRRTIKPRQGRTSPAAGTQNKHATALTSFFNWAGKKRLCRRGIAEDLGATKAAKKEEQLFTRRPFTTDELDRIFSQPLFTGCRTEHFINVPGRTIIRDHRFWLPPLALCSGGRLNELSQAQISDVKKFGEAYYLFIRTEFEPGEDSPEEIEQIKSLKTVNAKRLSPIHPILIKMGFLRYYERRKREALADGLLFPKFGYGQLYNQRILVNANAKDARTSFHSFRHNFKDALRDAGARDELQDRLLGHAAKTPGARYGEPLTPGEARWFFEAVKFSCLAHLCELGATSEGHDATA
jgi:integrase